MRFQDTGCTNMHRKDQWQSLVGKVFEVRPDGRLRRRGVTDEGMLGGGRSWSAPETVLRWDFMHVAAGFEVWTSLPLRSGCHTADPVPLLEVEAEAEAAKTFERIPARSGDAT